MSKTKAQIRDESFRVQPICLKCEHRKYETTWEGLLVEGIIHLDLVRCCLSSKRGKWKDKYGWCKCFEERKS